MGKKSKDIGIKNHTYHFFDDMKNLDPNKTKIHEKSYKNIFIFYTGYVTVKDLRF